MRKLSQRSRSADRWQRIVNGGLLLSLLWLTAGCGGKPTASDQSALKNDSTAEQAMTEVLKSLSESGITRQLSDEGSTYSTLAVHDIGKSHEYLGQSNKAAAAIQLGIYMSDLGYLMEFNKREEGKRYFEACLLLANHVGLQELFGKKVEFRFSDIIKGDENLQRNLDRLFKNTTNTAADEEFKKIHAAALAGYFIEELYHLDIFVSTEGNSKELQLKGTRVLLNQKEAVGNLIRYFDHLQLKPEGIALYQDFLKMQARYQALDAERLLKESDLSIILQDKGFNEILTSITSIRKSITGS
jgi:hypothetical protein